MRMPQFALRNTGSAISESMFVRSSAMGDGGAALVAICDAGSAAGWVAGLGWDPPEAHPRATRPATIAGTPGATPGVSVTMARYLDAWGDAGSYSGTRSPSVADARKTSIFGKADCL